MRFLGLAPGYGKPTKGTAISSVRGRGGQCSSLSVKEVEHWHERNMTTRTKGSRIEVLDTDQSGRLSTCKAKRDSENGKGSGNVVNTKS